jgi:hypothetical protein
LFLKLLGQFFFVFLDLKTKSTIITGRFPLAEFYQSYKRQSYKTFYGRNLRIFVISLSACHCQAFPA